MKGNIKNSTSSNRKSANLVQAKMENQAVGASQMGTSMRINSAVGSGSRPTKSSVSIGSSAPAQTQMIRPTNSIDKTPNYGK